MNTRSPYWRAATSKWTCPTPAGNSDSTCDPCGRETEGNWYHMHCRGQSTGEAVLQGMQDLAGKGRGGVAAERVHVQAGWLAIWCCLITARCELQRGCSTSSRLIKVGDQHALL